MPKTDIYSAARALTRKLDQLDSQEKTELADYPDNIRAKYEAKRADAIIKAKHAHGVELLAVVDGLRKGTK